MIRDILLILLFFLLSEISIFCKEQDSIQAQTIQMSKSPTGAIWRSLIVPGWGQLYVENYWKAPLFFGGFATLSYLIIYNHSNFIDYANKLENIPKTNPDYEITKLWREYYRDNRDMSAFYLIAVYILSAVDAYVGAHLYDFDINQDLSINFDFYSKNYIPYIRINLKF